MVYLLYRIKSIWGRYLDAREAERLNRFFETIVKAYYRVVPGMRKGVRDRRAKRKLIVSMTTIPDRLDKVWIVIESLLRQTYRPDQIVLWLAEDEFSGVSLPKKVRRQMRRGLTVRYCEDLRSYKKFYHTMLEEPDAFVVTVDDDMIYAETMLATLARTYKEDPGTVVCNRSHLIKKRGSSLAPYGDWIKYEDRGRITCGAQHSNFFTCGAGTLFPTYLLDKRVLEKEKFMEIAPTADDVWLNLICWVSGLKVRNTEGVLGNMLSLSRYGCKGLALENVIRKKNDIQIRAVLEYLEIDIKEYL